MPGEIGGRNWGDSFTAQTKFRIASSRQYPGERPGTNSPTEPVAGTNPADILILDSGRLELLVIHENFEFYWAQEKLLEIGISVPFTVVGFSLKLGARGNISLALFLLEMSPT